MHSSPKVYTDISLDWFDFSHIFSSGTECASIRPKKVLFEIVCLFISQRMFFLTCSTLIKAHTYDHVLYIDQMITVQSC